MVGIRQMLNWNDIYFPQRSTNMEYQCKNSKKEEPIKVYLRDLSMLVKGNGKDIIIFYSSIERVYLTRRASGAYSLQFSTVDKRNFTISNRYIHDSGHVEDKSAPYSMFVRVLHMHL